MKFERPNSATFSTQASSGAFWNKLLTAIEGAIGDIQDQVTDLATVQADLATAQADIVSQLAQILATQRRDSISASYTVPTLVATAADAGSNVTITIAGHTRFYGDETSKPVTGGTITAQPYSTLCAVYYDDAGRLGGAVTYQVTTDLKSAQNNFAAGRHYVATLTTPAAAGPPTSGGSPPPGSGYTGAGGGGGISIP